jgi:hypothetical protein
MDKEIQKREEFCVQNGELKVIHEQDLMQKIKKIVKVKWKMM